MYISWCTSCLFDSSLITGTRTLDPSPLIFFRVASTHTKFHSIKKISMLIWNMCPHVVSVRRHRLQNSRKWAKFFNRNNFKRCIFEIKWFIVNKLMERPVRHFYTIKLPLKIRFRFSMCTCFKHNFDSHVRWVHQILVKELDSYFNCQNFCVRKQMYM